jgi:hypothetical protein
MPEMSDVTVVCSDIHFTEVTVYSVLRVEHNRIIPIDSNKPNSRITLVCPACGAFLNVPSKPKGLPNVLDAHYTTTAAKVVYGHRFLDGDIAHCAKEVADWYAQKRKEMANSSFPHRNLCVVGCEDPSATHLIQGILGRT